MSVDDDDDDDKPGAKVKTEFDCPECNANNPYDDGFSPGDEVRCNYCGEEFLVEMKDDGRWRLRLL